LVPIIVFLEHVWERFWNTGLNKRQNHLEINFWTILKNKLTIFGENIFLKIEIEQFSI
jgi:hypothetical protein